ncbi:MAG: TonB-dependent receptor [Bacteroidota bacterium]
MLKVIAAVAMTVLSISTYAQGVVRGYVRDSLTQSPLPGATIVVANNGTTTDENGFFQINPGQAEISFVGYRKKIVELVAANEVVIFLKEDATLTDEVIVLATRATEKMGATFSNINKLTLQKQNFGQDLPMILNWTPSLVTTSDAGAGIGYTGLRIRGSDATRINVTINGIPYNDAESQGTFWVDVPDIATSTQSIQIQRGVGTSTNGAGAFGGSINLQTNVRNDKPYADVLNSFGSFGTHRHTIGLGSGLINGKFVFDGRVSTILSDGFIDRGSSNLKSFYLSGGYYGKRTIVKAIAFGGQEVTYQSWNGIPESKLNNDPEGLQVTLGDLGWSDPNLISNLLNSKSRTFNMFIYPNQVDNYKQDNYQLHFSHRFSEKFTANASTHLTYGRGYYEEYKYGQKLANYGLQDTATSDLVRDRWLKNYFYGLTFSLNYDGERFSSILGGGINRYDGDHYGNITWIANNNGVPPNHQYYSNKGVKDDANIYFKNTYEFTEKFSGFLDLQYRRVSHTMNGVENDQNTFDISKSFNFFNPKVGITYNITPTQNIYASFSRANREPTRDDFVDAPADKQPKPEKLNDVEAGWRFRRGGYSLSANYYYMGYRDQLVLTGALNDVGASLRTNVDKSYRTGIELEATGRLSRKFTLGANLTLSQNKVLNFKEVLYDYGPDYDQFNVIENNYKKTDISFSPNVIAGGIFSYTVFKGMELSWLTKFVGKQYLDNTSNEGRKIDSYFVNDLRVVYSMHPKFMREIAVSLFVNNLFDVKYQSNGYTYGYFAGSEIRQNYYYPQAGTNVMGMVALRF